MGGVRLVLEYPGYLISFTNQQKQFSPVQLSVGSLDSRIYDHYVYSMVKL
jgi:hypothetical protein